MKYAFLMTLLCCQSLQAQNWTWMGGNALKNATGNYTLSGTGTIAGPGGRQLAYYAKTSTDLYVMAGTGYAKNTRYGELNDLWKYNLPTGLWTFLKGSDTTFPQSTYGSLGVASVNNVPGGRSGGAAFTDAANNIWIFGGLGYLSDNFGLGNDMWKYTPQTNTWTWMKGSKLAYGLAVYGTKGIAAANNRPGARDLFSSTTDSAGNFWIFGGNGMTTYGSTMGSSGPLNDIWKFDITTNQWTWIAGDDYPMAPAVYGTKGVPSINNKPGGRSRSACWFDNSGNFWVFTGLGTDVSGVNGGGLNELWKYNPTTKEWTWVNGVNTLNQVGNYGTQFVTAASNNPGGRFYSSYFKDTLGNLCLFGGDGYNTGSYLSPNLENDVWKYNPATNMWTWIKGSSTSLDPGEYGTLGVTSFGNTPYGRVTGGWFVNGSYWMFGGYGYDKQGNGGYLSDLWKFDLFKTMYVFTGNGNWEDASNWANGLKPPAILPAGSLVSINPTSVIGECRLNTTFTVQPGALLSVSKSRKLIVIGNVVVQ